MKQEPYSIYIDKRPIRIAFLINPEKDTIIQIQRVIEYNLYKWGGRYNPIILTDGKTIEDNWWKLLNDIDPDVIISLLPLEAKLIQKIDLFLSPISLKIDNPSNNNVHSDFEGLSISPTIQNINSVFSSTLVLFDYDKIKDPLLEHFIDFNFCSYPVNLRDILELDDNNKKVFKIKEKKDLISALKDLSIYKNFAYPIQICSIPHKFRKVEYSGVERPFTVIVGDSPEDIVYNWNISLSYPEWQKKYFNNIWLSVDLANDIEFGEVLKKWLKTICWNSCRSNNRIKFISYSLSEEELKVISDRLTKKTLSNIKPVIYNEIEIPDFHQNYNYVSITNEMDPYYISGDQNKIKLNSPDVEKGYQVSELWVADIYMQFHPERYPNIQGITLWWKLPSKNELAIRIFGPNSRICSNQFPAVFLPRENPKININLPSDSEIFRILLTEKNRPILNSDTRNSIEQIIFPHVEPSNTGRYMSGFINLFKDLFIATQFLEKKYWRHMFDILSNVNPQNDDSKKEEIKNALSKTIKRNKNLLKNNEGLTWLTDYVLKLSRDIVILNKEITCSKFKKEVRRECKEFNLNVENKKLGYKNKHFIENLGLTLSKLVKLNIIQMGLRPKCPNCGIIQWYHIDEIQQSMICKGCRFSFTIKPEEKWFYKLNSLVQLGYSQQGLTPVILVLGQLLNESRASFIYDTSLNIFKQFDDDPFTDLDIVCIQDGKFIIGEIKQSLKQFEDDDFIKMKEVAKRIKPDIIIFSTLDKKCNSNKMKKIQNLEKVLQSLKIEVKWYQLRNDVFDSTPFL